MQPHIKFFVTYIYYTDTTKRPIALTPLVNAHRVANYMYIYIYIYIYKIINFFLLKFDIQVICQECMMEKSKREGIVLLLLAGVAFLGETLI